MSLEVKEFKAKQEKKIEDDKKKAEKKAAGETVSLHTRAQIQIAGLPFGGCVGHVFGTVQQREVGLHFAIIIFRI